MLRVTKYLFAVLLSELGEKKLKNRVSERCTLLEICGWSCTRKEDLDYRWHASQVRLDPMAFY